MSVTYEEWLESKGTSLTNKRDKDVKYYKDLYNATENTINTQYKGDITYAKGVRKNAEAAAATGLSDANAAADERLRGSIVQADDTFERDKVTYGQAAERLAQAGLTGSGYSDNLTRDAFASRATLYADANRTNAAEKHAAEVTYRDAMAKAASDEAEAKYLATRARDSSVATAAQDRDKNIHLTESDYEADMLALEGDKVKYEEEQKETASDLMQGGLGYATLDDVSGSGLTGEQQKAVLARWENDALGEFANIMNGGDDAAITKALDEVTQLVNAKRLQPEVLTSINNTINTTPQGFAYQYNSGKISAGEYIAKMVSAKAATGSTITGGWTIQGLGSGRENDDVDITIGSTSRGGGKGEFDLLCGPEVTDGETIKALNKLATGNEGNTPAAQKSWFAWLGDKANSNETPGKLVVYNGGLYLYTHYGWRTLKSDNNPDAVNKCIAAFLQSVPRNDVLIH